MAAEDKPEKDTAKAEREANKDARKAAKPEEADSDDTKKAEELQEQELEQGFRGTEVDMTPNEVYTVEGDSTQAPEAQADPVAAMKEATNPDVR